MILAKLKVYAMGALALAATFFYAMWMKTEAGKERMEREAAEKLSETERLGNEAAFAGLANEQKVRNEDVDISARSDFE